MRATRSVRPTHGFTLGGMLLLAFVVGCGDDAMDGGIDEGPSLGTRQTSTTVEIFDHGLGVPRSRMTVPAGWQVVHDIATNPMTARPDRFRLDQIGPNGELVRTLPNGNYDSQITQSFEQAWRRAVQHGMSGALEDVSVGPLQRSAHLAQFPGMAEAEQRGKSQLLEASLQATRGGQPYVGRVHVVNTPFPEYPGAGVFMAEVIVSPPGVLDAALRTNIQVAQTVQVTPEFEAAWAVVDQRVSARIQAEHKQRMANMKQQFDSHQARMAGQRAANDSRNQAWRQQHLGTGWNTGGSGGETYSAHEKYLDGAIREQDAFDDPDSGQRIRLDGHADQTYTDGLGNYIRTDDPSFDPAGQTGDWQQVQPLE